MQPTTTFPPIPAASLTPRQRRFAQHYVRCGNGAKAARLAGYSHRTARFIAHENLTKPDVRAFIEGLAAHAEVIGKLTPEHIAGMLLDEARGADHAGARVRAMELLGKWRGMFQDNVTVTTNLPVSALLSVVAKTHPDLAAKLATLLGAEDSTEPASAK